MKLNKLTSYAGSFSKTNILTFIIDTIYIASTLLVVYKNNSEFFFENTFQIVNIFFYSIVLLSFLLIKNEKLFFFISLFLILDFPVSLKETLLGLVTKYLNFPGFLGSQHLTYLLLFLIFGAILFLILKYNSLRYFQVYLIVFYSVSLIGASIAAKKAVDSSLRLGSPVPSISKNYYFFLFDEYPSEQIIRKYRICDTSSYPSVFLNQEGFKNDQNVYSNFISTERSTTSLLTGSFQTGYNVNKAIHAICKNVFTNGSNYAFEAFSLFDNQNRPNSEFSFFYFKDFNNLLTRKLIPSFIKFFSKRGVGRNTDWDVYNADAISKLAVLSKANHAHVVYIHFFTPHIYPLVWGQPMSARIKNANQWMLKAIKLVNKNDPQAGVLIFSDHGLRVPGIPFKLWNRNMFYFRNVKIDTALVNKNGLVSLVSSIKY